MKTYIYYYKEGDKTFSVNYKAKDINEALDIANVTGYELKGEKVCKYELKTDSHGISYWVEK